MDIKTDGADGSQSLEDNFIRRFKSFNGAKAVPKNKICTRSVTETTKPYSYTRIFFVY